MAKLEKVKEIKVVPLEKQEKSLVVVEKKQTGLAVIPDRSLIKNIVKKVSLGLVVALAVLYIMLMALVATSVFYMWNLQNGLIQNGVFVEGIDVSNLASEQAVGTLNGTLNGTIPECILLKYKENTYQISLQEIEARFNVEAAVEEAYEIGRTKNVAKDLWDYARVLSNSVNIEAELEYNDEILSRCLENLAQELPDKVQEYSYNIDGDKLIISRGKSGVELDEESLKNAILENLRDRNYAEIEITTIEVLPQEIDVQAVHDAVFVEPKDAYYTENPVAIYEQVVGVDFDVQNAQNVISSNPELEQYTIDLIFTNPNIFVRDLSVFPDVLSTFSTNYVNNANRTTNLVLATSKINGTVLMPGEMFSFNDVVGERTIEAGYKNAAIFINGQVEDGLAGGICQISSTLYDAVVGANLQIAERHNHSKLTSYLPGGKDATVVWGRYDFQFVNSREYPVKIEMSVQNGEVLVAIYGIKSAEEYEINIESQRVGTKGAYAIYEAYKVYRQNGVEVKREFLSRDFYK